MLKKAALRVLKKPTGHLTFSVVEKSQYKVGHQGKHYLSINSICCPVPGKLPRFKYQPAANLLNVSPSRCSCKCALGVNSGPK